ncbi:hypothetical protein BKI52_01050 [marine bacterium AO1-C]|nr:hypothetical protein BKI52_01050 [marine bacterium AO1-C]
MQAKKQLQKHQRNTSNNSIYRIPVVVHIIHDGEDEGKGLNLSDETIKTLIKNVNDDFRRKSGTRGHNTHPSGVDTQIEFHLAQISPEGLPTTGIRRIDYNKLLDSLGREGIEGYRTAGYWNPEQYFNIWFSRFSRGFLGRAEFPETDLPGIPQPTEKIEEDGIFINSTYFMEGEEGPYGLGRTLTHEIGHFLGLLHVWGIKSNCENDDYCDDTPLVSGPHGSCSGSTPLACNGEPAMIENYMDYSDDACMNIFTKDQMVRMRTVLEHSPRRKTLTTSPGLIRSDIGANTVKTYPNPALETLNVEFGLNVLGLSHEWILYNLQGQIIQRFTFVAKHQMVFNLPLVASKVLILKIQGPALNTTQKIMIGN